MSSRAVRLLVAVSLFGCLGLYLLYKSVEKYQDRVRVCNNLNRANETCDLFPRHRRRSDFRRIFEHWVMLAEKHNIPYVLACGSLLGQYRTQDIIPWDWDIDVYVDVRHYSLLKRLGDLRNFPEGSDDLVHFVVQPEFDERVTTKRRHWTCDGEVSVYFFNVSPKKINL